MPKKTSNNLIGCAGEYYVCAELCRQGLLALVTPKNNPLFDVVATNQQGSDSVAIQVKTMGIDNKQGWKLNKDIERAQKNPDLFVALVNLRPDNTTDFYIYEYDDLSARIRGLYSTYIGKPKRDGGQRKEVAFRWFDHKDFTDDDRTRKNEWKLIVQKLQRA
jgi:hypothetical protein